MSVGAGIVWSTLSVLLAIGVWRVAVNAEAEALGGLSRVCS